MEDLQIKFALKRFKIYITVQQPMAVFDAKSRQKAIYCAANGDAKGAQSAEIPRRVDGKR